MPTPEPCGNIVEAFLAIARSHPARLAMAIEVRPGRYEEVSYSELQRDTENLTQIFAHHGIGKGTRTLMMVPPGRSFAAAILALLKLGAPPVFVDPGMGLGNIGNCIRTARPVAFVGIRRAQLARRIFGWGKDSIRISLTMESLLNTEALSFEGAPAVPEQTDTAANPELAAIAFTSGSTGAPKGVAFTHANFLAQAALLGDLLGGSLPGPHLATFPLLFAFAPALGFTAVVPRLNHSKPATANPANLIAAIENYGCGSAFASPALVRKLALYCHEKQHRLATMQRIVSAGAPSDAGILGLLEPLLAPGGEIHTPYGATEALPVSDVSSREILAETAAKTRGGAGVCIGRSLPGLTVRIIPITDRPIADWSEVSPVPQGETGEIAVCGEVVSPYYFNDRTATELAKIPCRETNSLYHRMGDLGHYDEQGRLWMCGRKSHRVITPQRVFFTVPTEGIFNAHPEVARTALVGVAGTETTVPVLCVELAGPANRAARQRITQELLELGARFDQTRPIRRVLYHPSFPVDTRHNSKIRYEELAVWAGRKLRGWRRDAAELSEPHGTKLS